jgi:hypothetical protein
MDILLQLIIIIMIIIISYYLLFVYYFLEIYIVLYLFIRFLTQVDLRFSEKNHNLFSITKIFDYNNHHFLNREFLHLNIFLIYYKYFEINVLQKLYLQNPYFYIKIFFNGF